MPKPNPLLDAAQLGARLVYSETDLGTKGQAMYEEWSLAAEDAQEELADHWEEDWRAVMVAFRRTENALPNLNAFRQEGGDEPLTEEEDLEDFFRETEDWELQFLGSYGGFTLRVWSFGPWDGALAYAVASSEDGALASPTTLL